MSAPWRAGTVTEQWYLIFGAELDVLHSSEPNWELLAYTDRQMEHERSYHQLKDNATLFEVRPFTWDVIGGLKLNRILSNEDYPLAIMQQLTTRFHPLQNEMADFVCMASGGSRKRVRKAPNARMIDDCLGRHYNLLLHGDRWIIGSAYPGPEGYRDVSKCLKCATTETEV